MRVDAYIFSINAKDDARFYVKASDGQATIERIYAINGSLNQAELYAAQFVALCLKRPHEINITTDSYYIEGVLCKENNEWKKIVEGNQMLVNQTRSLFDKLNFKIKIDDQEINKIRSSILA